MQALGGRPIQLTYPEGCALQVLDALLGLSRVLPREPVDLRTIRPALADVVQRRLAAAILRYLTQRGGYRERAVLRDGRRARGRLWDSALNENLRLRFTPATSRLWRTAARTLPALSARALAQQEASTGTAEVRKILRALTFDSGTTDVGDWVFAALAFESLERFQLVPEDRDLLVARLGTMSPLVALMAPDAGGAGPEWLFEPRSMRVLECVEDSLADAWCAYARQTWTSRGSAASVLVRWNALGRTLARYVEAADAARRMDLTRAVMRTLVRIARENFSEGGEAARMRLANWRDMRNLRERDALHAAVISVVGLAGSLMRRRDELAQERYGDTRHEEAQLYLRFVSEELSPDRGALDGIVRALSSTVG